MTREEKSSRFDRSSREVLLQRRVLVLDGVLDEDNGVLLTSQLLGLAAEDEQASIALWIHSPGGSVPAMLAIRDVMQLVPCAISTVALGLACSAGQFLLGAGTPGMRYALPHARVLLHQGCSGIGGSAAEVEVQAGDLRAMVTTVVSLIAKDTGRTYEQVYADSLHDRWFSAQQALEYGFVDQIVDDFAQVMPRRSKVGIG